MGKYVDEKAIEDAAEGFWARHKWCVIGGAALLAVGLVIGLVL